MKALRISALLTALLLAGPAQAQNNWSSPGSACVPSGESIAAAAHKTSVTSIRFATGAVGQIELVCPIQRFNSATPSYKLKLTYEDSTGKGTTASVTAQLYRMANTTTEAVLLGSASSNSSAASTANTVSSSTINHTFDFEANIYWVRVLIKRGATNETAIFHSVILDGTAL